MNAVLTERNQVHSHSQRSVREMPIIIEFIALRLDVVESREDVASLRGSFAALPALRAVD
jgi:hypothetical protein